jgi:hypothetical protein
MIFATEGKKLWGVKMTTEEAIKKFEQQLATATVVLDFGRRPDEYSRVFRERKEMAEIALAALRAQRIAKRKILTNGDHVRSMSDEELSHIIDCQGGGCATVTCEECCLRWLQQLYVEDKEKNNV